MGFDYSLSASKLNKFNECKRCFWDYCTLKIQYRGIFPSLPGGLDRTVKNYLDQCRQEGRLPTEIRNHVPEGTKLFGTAAEIRKYRNWQSSLKPTIKTKFGVVSLIMAFDDLLITPSGIYAPLDAKSKGDQPKTSGAEYYQTQLDTYGLGMVLSGWKITGEGYLWYLWPEIYEGATLRMGSQVFALSIDPNRAMDLIERAVECLAGGQPDASPTCDFCKVAQIRVENAVQAVAHPATLQA